MSDTKINTKVTKAQILSGEQNSLKSASKGVKAQSASTDTFGVVKAQRYKRVVEGRQSAAHYHGIQGILDSLCVGVEPTYDPDLAFVDDPLVTHEIPPVPDLELDIFRYDSEAQRNMKPILDRYIILEGIIMAMLMENIAVTEDPSWMAQTTAEQIRDHNLYIEDLEKQLAFCRDQRELAEVYYQWDLEMDAEEAKQAKVDYMENFWGIDNPYPNYNPDTN